MEYEKLDAISVLHPWKLDPRNTEAQPTQLHNQFEWHNGTLCTEERCKKHTVLRGHAIRVHVRTAPPPCRSSTPRCTRYTYLLGLLGIFVRYLGTGTQFNALHSLMLLLLRYAWTAETNTPAKEHANRKSTKNVLYHEVMPL